jgi:hypothetical protein
MVKAGVSQLRADLGEFMTTRTRRKLLTFAQPFLLRGIDAVVPAGTYRIDTDEELIEGLSFLAYRRTATWIPSSLDHNEERLQPTDSRAALGTGNRV